MSKSMISFVAGSITTGIIAFAILALSDSSDEPTTAGVEAIGSGQSEGTTNVSQAESQANDGVPQPATARDELFPDVAQEDQVEQEAGLAESAVAVGVTFPIPVTSTELGAHFEDPRVASVHAEVEREPLDSSWAPTTENQIVAFYAGQPQIIVEYGIPSVHCRRTLCEIQVVAYGADGRNWLSLNQGLFDQPWAEQFEDGPVGYGFAITSQGDATVITQWLKRNVSEAQATGVASATI